MGESGGKKDGRENEHGGKLIPFFTVPTTMIKAYGVTIQSMKYHPTIPDLKLPPTTMVVAVRKLTLLASCSSLVVYNKP